MVSSVVPGGRTVDATSVDGNLPSWNGVCSGVTAALPGEAPVVPVRGRPADLGRAPWAGAALTMAKFSGDVGPVRPGERLWLRWSLEKARLLVAPYAWMEPSFEIARRSTSSARSAAKLSSTPFGSKGGVTLPSECDAPLALRWLTVSPLILLPLPLAPR